MKQQEDLDKLRELGISMIYMGLESGNDEVLTYMKKGVTSQEMIEAAQKVKQAKIRLSVTAISGLGGRRLWKEHAKDTGLVFISDEARLYRIAYINDRRRSSVSR